MSEQINQAKEQLEKLKETEEKAIQAIQQNIDESAKEMAAQHAEFEKQKQELDEKYANFVKEMDGLKEQLKEKINWTQVDRVMGFFSSSSIRTEEPLAEDNVSDQNLVIFLCVRKGIILRI
jgi:chromosome segregation ATPase